MTALTAPRGIQIKSVRARKLAVHKICTSGVSKTTVNSTSDS